MARRPRRECRGVIEAYRDRMPVQPGCGSRCVRAARPWCLPPLSGRTGCEVFLKVEGANPTGSFKDRGMTIADHRRAGRGRAGRDLRVDRQHLGVGGGVRRPGRPDLRGARSRRARSPRQAGAGRRHGAPGSCRSTATSTTASNWPARGLDYPVVALVNSVNPARIEGQKTAASRSSTCSATPPTCTACRSATPATSPRTGWATGVPRDGLATGCRGCSASRPRGRAAGARRAGPDPETIATAIRIGAPASWTRRPSRPKTSRAGGSRPSPTTRSSPPTGCLRRREAVFVEPASAASVAGLLAAAEAAGWPGPRWSAR